MRLWISLNIRQEELLKITINVMQDAQFCRQDTNRLQIYEGWNFNSGNYLFTTDTKQIHVSKFYCPSL